MKTGRLFSISIAVIMILTAVIIIDSEIDIIPEVNGAVLHVPASYTTIQSAINSASPGDTIVLSNGSYYESILINKTITLIGNGSSVIDDLSLRVVQVQADNVSIIGINISTLGYPEKGIEVLGVNDTLIQDCTISNVRYGIDIVNTRNCVVNDTTVFGSETGFYVSYAENTTISNCRVDPDPSNINFLTRGIGERDSGNSTFIDNVITTPSGIGTRTSYDTEISNNMIHYFDPANYTSNWGSGIVADPNTVCVIYGNSIMYYGSGLFLSGSNVVVGNVLDHIAYGSSINGDSNVISHNRFNDSQYMGITLYGNNNTMSNNTFSNISWSGIKIEDSDGGNVVDSCSFENVVDPDITIDTSKNITLTNNSMENGIQMIGTSAEYWTTHQIDTSNSASGKPLRYYSGQENISISGPTGQVIFANCSKMDITSYYFSDVSFPLSIAYSDNISVDANEFVNGTTGIYLRNTHNINITTNTFYNNDFGIWWNSSSEDIVHKNLFKMNNKSIYVEGSSYLQVTNNTFESYINDIEARLLEFSRIEGNDHINSTEVKSGNIFMAGSIGNVITLNNGPEIIILGGSLNMIYHNIDLKESFDFEAGNIWNLDYPHGGNHWASYSGKDFLKGPHQDIIGGDWIGDDPVYLNQYRTVKDEYPLMSPYGSITEGGSIFISNPDDGDVVSGNILIEANVVSSHFYWVNFYVDGELALTDSEFPYQMVFYSIDHPEGSIVNITAQLEFITIPNATATVFVTVDNVVEETDTLVVDTNSAEYHPDQQLTVNVSFQGSYVQFDDMVITAVLDGPDPIKIHYNRFEFEASDSFMFLLDIPSDIPTGDYVLKIEGSAYWGDINLWRSTNTTTFQISGKDIHSELEDIDSLLELMDNFEVTMLNDTVNSIYQALMDLQMDVDFINGSFSQSFTDLQSSLSLLEMNLIGKLDTLELNITRLLNNMNASIQQMFAMSISSILGRLDDVDLSFDLINTGIGGIDSDLITTRADILDAIGEHDDAMFENTTGIIDLIGLRFDQLEILIMIVNSTIHYHLDEMNIALNAFKMDTMDRLSGMQDYLEMINSTTNVELMDIQDSINATQILLVDLDTESMEAIGTMFQEMMDRIDELDEDQAAYIKDNITQILLEFIDLNSNIDEHSSEILTALDSLNKLDEILEDVESVEAGVKESEQDLSEKDDTFQTFLRAIIVFLIVILVLQAFMLASMRKKGKDEGRGDQPEEVKSNRNRPEPKSPPMRKSQMIKSPKKQPPRRPKTKTIEEADDWEEFEELEEF